MKRGFEFARKLEFVDGKKAVVIDKNTGLGIKAFEKAQIPEYQTKNSAGADFFCAEEVTIPSIWSGIVHNLFVKFTMEACKDLEKDGVSSSGLCPTVVHTGIKAFMEEDEVLELYNRSSNPRKLGLILANGVGVVDSDFYNNVEDDGEIRFAFYNLLPWSVTIKVGDRIGQGIFKKYLRPDVGLRVKDAERQGGFGSTN